MKNKLITISLLLVSILSIFIYFIIKKDNNVEFPIQKIEDEYDIIEETNVKESNDEHLPEVDITLYNEESNSVVEENENYDVDIENNNQEGNKKGLTDQDLQKIDDSEYITIGDDERIRLNDDGSISINLVDDNNNSTELIFE